jgi:uncharacterized membrane protein/nitrite reductase/ring-hydroxylating ferredoxin subunit
MSIQSPHPYDLAAAIERQDGLDTVSRLVGTTWRAPLRSTRARDLLSGRWLGHPFHPLATDVVVGTLTSATLLDVAGPQRFGPASDVLSAVGLAASIPTVLSGWSEWLDTEGSARRAGIAHAAANGLATAAYLTSLRQKRRGRRGAGVMLSLAGAAAMGLGGYLGAHLAYARGAGVDRTAFEPRPRTWTPLPELPEDVRTATLELGDVTVLAVRTGSLIHVVASRCTRCGSPLVVARDDRMIAACRGDGSRFRLVDGRVLRGPAAVPLPVYETRTHRGRIEVQEPLVASA